MNRREFLEMLAKALLGTLGFVMILSLFSRKDYSIVESEVLAKNKIVFGLDELKRKKAIKFEYNNRPALLIYYNNVVKAYDATCPHMGCPVNANYLEKGVLSCPCHLSTFDALSGKRLSGPAPHGLKELKVKVINDKIYIG